MYKYWLVTHRVLHLLGWLYALWKDLLCVMVAKHRKASGWRQSRLQSYLSMVVWGLILAYFFSLIFSGIISSSPVMNIWWNCGQNLYLILESTMIYSVALGKYSRKNCWCEWHYIHQKSLFFINAIVIIQFALKNNTD